MNLEDLQIETKVVKILKFFILSFADYWIITIKIIFSPRKAWESINKEEFTITPLIYYVYSILLVVGLSACVDEEYYKPFQVIINSIEKSKLVLDAALWSIGAYILGPIVIISLIEIFHKIDTGEYCDFEALCKSCFFASAIFIPAFFIEGVYLFNIEQYYSEIVATSPTVEIGNYSIVPFAWYVFRKDLLEVQLAFYFCLGGWGYVFYQGIISQIAKDKKTTAIKKAVGASIIGIVIIQICGTITADLPTNLAKDKFSQLSHQIVAVKTDQKKYYSAYIQYSSLAMKEELPLDLQYVSWVKAASFLLLHYDDTVECRKIALKNILNKRGEITNAENILREIISDNSGAPKHITQTYGHMQVANILLKIDTLKKKPGFSLSGVFERSVSLLPNTKYLKVIP